MKVQVCIRCLRLMNREQFLYRQGTGVHPSQLCVLCRHHLGNRTPCKTEICPDCSLPSPIGNFCLFFHNRAPIRKATCTECRCLAQDPDTLQEINSDPAYTPMSEGLMYELGLLEIEELPELKPSLVERATQWVTQLIKRP